MGARRDDITARQRKEIAIEVLSPHRPWGTVSRLAGEYGVTPKTVYNIRDAAAQVLEVGLQPGPHGPQPVEKALVVGRNRLLRGTVVLTEQGVSQRGVAACLEELLDTRLSPSWVNGTLAQVEEQATAVNTAWRPQPRETLSGDEIFSHGQPNLLVVGNDSLFIHALTRQPTLDGDTWGCVLLETPASPQFASDGGTALAAGLERAEIETGHQLDWDHLLRPLWGQVAHLERQAYAALEKVEERGAQFDQAQTPGRLQQHFKAWEKLRAVAEEQMTRHDEFLTIAQQVDDWFALIDLPTGQLRDPVAGAASLRHLSQQLASWEGRIYQKLSRNLASFAEGLFSYQPVLAAALAPLIEQ